jgi:uncharacterized protein YacL
MLDKREEAFLAFWETNRIKEKKNIVPLIKGVSIGLAIGLAIILIVSSDWYERAGMAASTQLNPYIFLIIIVAIAFFMAWLYSQYRWERLEQQYLELLAKKRKEHAETSA